jgi:hypothetical protein
MPKLPRIEPSTQKMTTASPNRRLDPQAESQPGRDLSEFGKAVAYVGFKLQDAQDLQEETAGQNYFSVETNKLHQEVANNKDLSPAKKKQYDDRLQEIKNTSAQFVTNPLKKSAYMQNADANVSIAQIKIDDTFRTKMIEAGAANLEFLLNDNKKEFASTNDLRTQRLIMNRVKYFMAKAYNAGFISREEYVNKSIKLEDEFLSFKFQTDLLLDQPTPQDNLDKLAKTKDNLAKGVYGFSLDKRVKAEESLATAEKRAVKEHEAAKEEIIDTNTSQFLEADLTKMSVVQMLEFNNRTPVDEQILRDTIAWKMNDKTVDTKVETKKDVYMDLANKVTDPGKLILETRRQISQAQKDGNIKANDALNLNTLLTILGKEAENFKTRGNPFMNAIKNGIKALELANVPYIGGPVLSFAPTMKLIEDVVKKKITTPEQVTESVNNSVKEIKIEVNPHIGNTSEKGTLMRDRHGNEAIVYPDGRIEPR